MRLRITITILAALAAALLSACASNAAPAPSANSNEPAPSANSNAPVAAAPTVAPTSAPAPTAPPAPTSANPQELLSKAMSALTSAKTLRLTLSATTGGKSETSVFEYAAPSAYHLTQPNDHEVIVIKGKGAYEKQGGKWSKLPLPTATIDAIISTVNPVAVVDKERKKLDQKTTPQVGADILNGRPMVTYQYNNPEGKPGFVKFWYGVTDGWLYKIDGSDPTGKATGTIDYNVPVTIVAPLP